MTQKKTITNLKPKISNRKYPSYFPLCQEIRTTNHTPRSLYKKLYSGHDYSFLLESGKGPLKTSRHSFLGGNPFRIIRSKNDRIEIIENEKIRTIKGNPIQTLREALDFRIGGLPGFPGHFWGGCVGFLGYDIVHFFEELPKTTTDDANLPDMVFMFPSELVVFDHAPGIVRAIVILEKGLDRDTAHGKGTERLNEFANRINKALSNTNKNKIARGKANLCGYNQTRREFEGNVQRVKKYIKEGDIYQANISRRIELEYSGDHFSLYERLFDINPSPFSSFLQLGGFSLVSGSPERLLKIEGLNVTTRPIAGTRPRGNDPDSDNNMSRELLLSEKERAEHLMLVDLERNDLGRICRTGSVEVDEFMVLESYSHVWHIISNIKGKLKDGVDLEGILSACFPGGTVTGCPKVRCMEIIDELEPTQRGPYTGSIGYIGFDGRMDLNIIIRTIVLKDGKAHIQVGAGIVADSIPSQEFQETEKKAEAMMEALFMNGV